MNQPDHHVLSISHTTSYQYDHPVRGSKNEIRMRPAATPWQVIKDARLDVTPSPDHLVSYQDYFGTTVDSFEVAARHENLKVTASAEVAVHRAASKEFPPPDVKRSVEFLPASPMVAWGREVDEIAASLRKSTAAQTLKAVLTWMRSELAYESGSTVVGTPVNEVLQEQRGVCQDFAHLCCALLRANSIPARYVSGYFAPKSLDPGESVDAQSHAWIEALAEDGIWMPADPTNDIEPAVRHVKVGHGRDYSDVVPFQGVHSGQASQALEVEVVITRIE